MPGPKKEPTALKIIKGNPGKQKLPDKEPIPKSRAPKCPDWLIPEGKGEWTRIIPELDSLGLATNLDLGVLAGYCQSYARWKEAEDELRETYIVMGDKGYMNIHPLVTVSHKYQDKMLKYAAELGLSPSARTKIEVERPEQDTGWEEFGIGK
jgi:P27 family predicted phage terminase small subunit